jgi:hypothetical protein
MMELLFGNLLGWTDKTTTNLRIVCVLSEVETEIL